jgi:asparagine synthase (glutamine-hydrolysing)
MSFDFKIRRSLTGLSYPASLWNPVWLGPVEPAHLHHIFEEPFPVSELLGDAIALWERDSNLDYVDRTIEFYTNFYLPGDILTKVDRAAMMCSLESRAVFLDNDLTEFCRRLPNRFKYRNGQRKYLLKKAIAGLVPATLLKRSKKGFGIPLAKWLRELPAPTTGPMDGIRRRVVERCWSDHRSGLADHRLFLWSWLSLQAVLRRDLTRLAQKARWREHRS